MKNILRGLVVTVLVVGLSWQLFAQVPLREKNREKMRVPQELLTEQMEKLSEELNLTPEQKAKLSQIINEREQERAKRISRAKEEFQRKLLKRLSEELQLTLGQKGKISQIVEDGWQKTVRERKKMMKTVRAVRISVDKRIEKILTPAQLKKFEIFKKHPTKQPMEGIKRQRHGKRGNRGIKGIPPESE